MAGAARASQPGWIYSSIVVPCSKVEGGKWGGIPTEKSVSFKSIKQRYHNASMHTFVDNLARVI